MKDNERPPVIHNRSLPDRFFMILTALNTPFLPDSFSQHTRLNIASAHRVYVTRMAELHIALCASRSNIVHSDFGLF